ncbi:MAG: polyprenyl synthetase family protein [Olsenella sp.]|nr:polyprenyl synthetase family protein [Olsenella sp.]
MESEKDAHSEKSARTPAFANYLAEKRPLIEAFLAETTPHVAGSSPADTRGGGRLAQDLEASLYGPLARFTASGGKRTRPALCLLGAEAVGGTAESALSVAAAVENFQSAALIHDDIADEGELRRGEPCLHVSEGTGVAINIGDLALVTATEVVLADDGLTGAAKLRILGELTAMERRTLEGQALDLSWVRDGRWDIDVDDYLFMASHKTAYYSAAVPLVMGAICAGGSERQIEALRSFGMAAGLAFQLQDDLLNLVGDAAAQGKDFRSDVTEGKRTMAAVWAVRHLGDGERDELVGILSSKTTDETALARAVSLMEECGAIAHVQATARELVGEAKAHLASADFSADATQTLSSMADFFIERLG